MKKLLTICLAIALCFGLASVLAETNPLVGTWRAIKAVTGNTVFDLTSDEYEGYLLDYTFNADYTFVITVSYYGETDEAEGTYKISGNKMTQYADGTSATATFEIDGDILIMDADVDGVHTTNYYRRLDPEDRLLGLWTATSVSGFGQTVDLTGTYENGLSLTFNADGTCIYTLTDNYVKETEYATYTATADTIYLVEDGITSPLPYTISGDTMSLTMSDGSTTLIWTLVKSY